MLSASGYIAHEGILAISRRTHLVRLFARRFTVQERLGGQIADTLNTLLAPHGVAADLEAPVHPAARVARYAAAGVTGWLAYFDENSRVFDIQQYIRFGPPR